MHKCTANEDVSLLHGNAHHCVLNTLIDAFVLLECRLYAALLRALHDDLARSVGVETWLQSRHEPSALINERADVLLTLQHVQLIFRLG